MDVGGTPGEDLREVRVVEFIPGEWLSAGTKSVWIRGYRAFRVDLDELRRSTRSAERPVDLRIVVFWGQPSYPVPGKVTLISETNWRIDASTEIRKAITGAYVLLITPYKVDDQDGNELMTVRRLDAAAGALVAVCGRAGVFEHVFDYEFHVEGRFTFSSPPWENPLAFQSPRFESRHAVVYSLLCRVASGDSDSQLKANLSLRWLEAATYSRGGVDGFLKYWIALETLCMTSYGDLRPIVQGLARAYALSPSEAGDRFAVGRLFGLRGRILHQGAQPAIDGTLLKFMEGIYGDVVLEMFGLASLRRAEEVLVENPQFDLRDVLKKATVG